MAPQQWDKTPHFPFTQMTILQVPWEIIKTFHWGKKEFQRVIYICLWLLRYTTLCNPQELSGVTSKKFLL